MKQAKSSFGFTFIELLISMSIMVLLFTVGLGSYREFTRRQQIDSIVREIKGDLRFAQQQAVVGQKPNVVECNNSDLVGYKVSPLTGRTGYQILAVCGSSEVFVKENEYLDSDIQISIPNVFTFNALAKGVSNDATIVVEQVSSAQTTTISIDTNGEIK